uniref:Membrane-associated protein n=1 Tax=Neobodo designis TaxID=312471 RepID=A0A7S1QUR8_NEODS|mmetsp:Transcript_52546/g.161737  ORF Transcript_52546/g.161737 Transcript_52546/m.161737 type:complete len:214 (+) Transcript_52546:57-698(+)|eukprot:CAMPEP_0174855616 /NCGR_PEP_ID=MMETSP1114-20130205/33752_1 /TAXON_ID=312471 /ORGANISM="Neobodo designis, Strain CCAP 1951/1" /LENGTH=213 /DNA_ID=CAMNT_0016090361 /DNA_START=54 /DNA_END=695 /DNA_ORIENTATION=+
MVVSLRWVLLFVCAFLSVRCQSGRTFVLVNRAHSEVFSDATACNRFAETLASAVSVSIGVEVASVGAVSVPCENTLVVNRTASVAPVVCERDSTCLAIRALATFRGWNAVKATGIIAISNSLDVEDRSKEEGLAAYAVVLTGCLIFTVASIVSTACFRRSAVRRARSVKFKDLVRFEIELAGGGDDDFADGAQGAGVPLPTVSHHAAEPLGPR